MGRAGAGNESRELAVGSWQLLCWVLVVCCIIFSCNNPTSENTESQKQQTAIRKIQTPNFNSDSSYSFLEKQVKFGPRVPGTNAHAACAEYLKQKISSYGFLTQIQSETIGTCDGKKFRLKNIVAEYKPELSKRILLTAHWDTRPWADQDSIDMPLAR